MSDKRTDQEIIIDVLEKIASNQLEHIKHTEQLMAMLNATLTLQALILTGKPTNKQGKYEEDSLP